MQRRVEQWCSQHPREAVRFLRDETDDGCVVIDVFGNELQVYALDEGEGFFVSTDDEDAQLNSTLTELNDTSTLLSLPELLSHACKLLSSTSCALKSPRADPASVSALDEALGPEPLARLQSATVCNEADLWKVQGQQIKKLRETTGLDDSAAILLLLRANWDGEAAHQRFLAGREAALAEAGVIPASGSALNNASGTSLCSVCFADEASTCLPCGHGLCADCWPAFLRCNLESGTVTGDNCLRLKCPGERCPMIVPPHVFKQFLDREDYARYERLLSVSFMRGNPNIVQCPATGCELCVAFSQRKSTVSCDCGHVFCFSCKNEAHAPASCRAAKEWVAKRDRTATKVSKQLSNAYAAQQENLVDTKPCPNPDCGTLSHKATGCHYLSCTQCRENWCWQCGEWGGGPSGRPEPHHVSTCNQPKNKEWLIDKAASVLDNDGRFAFYRERHENHLRSLEFAKKLREAVPGLVQGAALRDADLIHEATELLIECRLVLAWTFVWAFSEKDDGRRQLFEFVQRDLEVKTELLSGMIEGRPTVEILGQRNQLRDYVLALRGYLENIKQYEEVSKDDSKAEPEVEPPPAPRYMRAREGAVSKPAAKLGALGAKPGGKAKPGPKARVAAPKRGVR